MKTRWGRNVAWSGALIHCAVYCPIIQYHQDQLPVKRMRQCATHYTVQHRLLYLLYKAGVFTMFSSDKRATVSGSNAPLNDVRFLQIWSQSTQSNLIILNVPLPTFALFWWTDTFPKYRRGPPCRVPESESCDTSQKSHLRDCGPHIPNRTPVLHAGDTRTEKVKQKQLGKCMIQHFLSLTHTRESASGYLDLCTDFNHSSVFSTHLSQVARLWECSTKTLIPFWY